MQYISERNISQQYAHNLANTVYNYETAATKHLESLRKSKKKKARGYS